MIFHDAVALFEKNPALRIEWENDYPLLSHLDMKSLDLASLRKMQCAGDEMLAVLEQAAAQNYHILSSVLSHEEELSFEEWAHYPAGDVHDHTQGAIWFYHAHSAEEGEIRPWNEHGHFHLFLYTEHFPEGVKPVALPEDPDLNKGGLVHLVAVSFNHQALPIRIFTTNRWVSDEWMYSAETIMPLLERFVIHQNEYSLTSRWLIALLKLYRPQVEWALKARDHMIENRQEVGQSFFENEEIEVLSAVNFDLATQIDEIEAALNAT